MCSRSVIFVHFCSRCKNGENEKNSDLDPNIQICAKTSVGFYVFLLKIQVIIIKNRLQSVFIESAYLQSPVFLVSSYFEGSSSNFERSFLDSKGQLNHFERSENSEGSLFKFRRVRLKNSKGHHYLNQTESKDQTESKGHLNVLRKVSLVLFRRILTVSRRIKTKLRRII
ncbi:hypothetical protein HanIR_Chr14g0718191 [Helianthus annuus]|nr:hypothetical protein HanIR_Chr14g0718191 [Helianthus annuus]